MEQSLPIQRRGSRWQRQPSLVSLAATNWGVLRRPIRFWSDVRIHEPRVALLLGINLAIAALLPTLALLVSMCGPIRHLNVRYLGSFFLGCVALMAFLTFIEFAGLSFFARQRGWRVPRDSSFVIVSHASVGWIISGLAVGLVWVTWTLIDFYNPALLATRLGSLGVLGDLLAPGIGLAFVSGMIVFSLLAGAGWRALRFANRLAPGEV